MKLHPDLKEYLSFSKNEQRGIIVLLVLLLIVASANRLIPGDEEIDTMNYPAIEKEMRDFGQRIRKAESDDSVKFAQSRSNRPHKTWQNDSSSKPGRSCLPVVRVDLNKADTLELQRLSGIGPSYARRIVGYRARLGGFVSCRQLLEVWGVDTALYNRIKNNVFVMPDSLRTMDINTVSFKELLKHPYFPYELTRSLVLYRQKNKIIRTIEELRKVEGVNDSVFGKIRPYVKL